MPRRHLLPNVVGRKLGVMDALALDGLSVAAAEQQHALLIHVDRYQVVVAKAPGFRAARKVPLQRVHEHQPAQELAAHPVEGAITHQVEEDLVGRQGEERALPLPHAHEQPRRRERAPHEHDARGDQEHHVRREVRACGYEHHEGDRIHHGRKVARSHNVADSAPHSPEARCARVNDGTPCRLATQPLTCGSLEMAHRWNTLEERFRR